MSGKHWIEIEREIIARKRETAKELRKRADKMLKTAKEYEDEADSNELAIKDKEPKP